MVEFTGPYGKMLEINPDEIVSIRPPRDLDQFTPEVQCVIFTTDSKIIGVRNNCHDVVLKALRSCPHTKNMSWIKWRASLTDGLRSVR